MASSVCTPPRLEYVAVNLLCVLTFDVPSRGRGFQLAAFQPDGDGGAHMTMERADAVRRKRVVPHADPVVLEQLFRAGSRKGRGQICRRQGVPLRRDFDRPACEDRREDDIQTLHVSLLTAVIIATRAHRAA
jgi:hypothetical protein